MRLHIIPMTKYFFLLLVLCLPQFGSALGPSPSVEEYLEQFHLDAAAIEAGRISDPATRNFYLLHIQIYKYMSTQDEAHLEGFDDFWGKTIDLLEDQSDTLPLRSVMLAELYGKKAMLSFLQENYFASLRMVRQCHKWTKRAAEKFPDNVEQLKFQGLFNVVFASVPKKYQGLAAMIGYVGDAELGMEQLELAAKKSRLLRAEIHFIVFFAEKNVLGKAEKAMVRMEKLRKELGPNMMIDFLLASAYCGMHLNDKALSVLDLRDTYAADKRVFFTPYWDHILGKAYYFKGDYEKSRLFFRRFLAAHKGNIYEVDAKFRLGMSLILSGDVHGGQKIFRSLQETKASPFDEDEYAMAMAKRFAEQAPSPHLKQLFKARNFFDGGYQEEALATLRRLERRKENLSSGELTELYYRFGRVFHTQGELISASEHYAQCVTQPPSDQKWMQAYATFYMGDISREKEKKEEAIAYYKSVLQYDKYFYQAGLENRCKAILSEMKN